MKPNRSLGIKFLCVSQFDFAVVATTAFYLNFPRAFITTEMTALMSPLPVRLDGHVIKVACKRSTACVYHNHVNNNALDSLTKALSR